jgi:hypothetical protein
MILNALLFPLQMSVLVLAFVLCWLPFWMLYTALPVCLLLEVGAFQM